MELTEQLRQIPKSSRPVLLLILGGVVLLSFLAGFIPMWIEAEREQRAVANLEREAVRIELENTLGAAAIEARDGRYEPARQKASEFFTDLRLQLDQGQNSALPSEQQDPASKLLNGRDELITLLARGDPAGADRLSELYLAYREIMAPGKGNPARAEDLAGSGKDAPVGGSP
jgi:hypothetical protein